MKRFKQWINDDPQTAGAVIIISASIILVFFLVVGITGYVGVKNHNSYKQSVSSSKAAKSADASYERELEAESKSESESIKKQTPAEKSSSLATEKSESIAEDYFYDDEDLKSDLNRNLDTELTSWRKDNLNELPFVEYIGNASVREFKTAGYRKNTIKITVTPDFKDKYTSADLPEIEDNITPYIKKALTKSETSPKKTEQINKFFNIDDNGTPTIQFVDIDTNKEIE